MSIEKKNNGFHCKSSTKMITMKLMSTKMAEKDGAEMNEHNPMVLNVV